ncbi:MAG: N-acetyl-gamma-glutamyl-phosphate reductase [Clostridia bacterium]|nr:N-acetyl-gamma-glutamyl-phosphate reductase [Clostridia bacterium]
MKTVFIDGKAGTTGLRIYERLGGRADLEMITLPEAYRKDEKARREAINSADVAFLCLPDAAAREAVAMVDNPHTVIIDTSTAHRTDPAFAYGFPELSPSFEEKIKNSKRIAVPGCHASGFIALVYPLIANGILSPSARLCCHSVTGYSGGGKKMIAEYEAQDRDPLLGAPRQYALTQEHKHLKEMKAVTGLSASPIFCPIVSDFYSGMVVTVPLFKEDVGGASPSALAEIYRELYRGPVVSYADDPSEGGFLSGAGLSGKDGMQISVLGNADRMLLVARYDNLGKGASGAAVENLNIVLGLEKTLGLEL